MEKSKKEKKESKIVRVPTLHEYHQTLSEQEKRSNMLEVKSTLKTLRKYGFQKERYKMKEKKLLNETLHKLEEASNTKLYVRANISGYLYLLTVSGLIIAQASDITTLHNRMIDILNTYKKEGKE